MKRFVCWFAIAAASTAYAADDEQKDDIGSFPTDEYVLTETSERGSVTIHFDPAHGVDAKQIGCDVIDTGSVAPEAFAKPTCSPTTIVIPLDFTHLQRAGTYPIRLHVFDNQTPPKFKPVYKTIKLTHATAKARAIPETLVIECVGAVPSMCEWNLPKLELEETSGLSRLTAAGTDLRESKVGERLVDVKLTLQPVEVPPGGRNEVFYSIPDDVPDEIVKGKAELRAPQLEEPVIVAYELRTRVSSWMIALILAVGLGIGHLAKKRYRLWLDKTRLRRELAQLAKHANDARSTPDEELRPKLNAIVDACRAHIEARSDVATLTKAYEEQQQAIEAALASWKTRLAEQQAEVASLAQTLETAWLLPEALRSWLTSARESTVKARLAIARDDARTAAQHAASVFEKPEEVATAIGTWKQRLQSLATHLETAPTVANKRWPEPTAAIAPAIGTRINDLLSEIDAKLPTKAAELADWLPKLHAVQAHLDASATRMETTWLLVATAAERELADLPQNPLAGFAATLPPRGADPSRYLEDVAAKGAAIVDSFRKRLTEKLTNGAKERVENLITEGKWAAAAAEAAPALAGQGNVLGDETTRPAEPFAAPAAPSAQLPPAAALVIPAAREDINVVLARAIRAERNTARFTTALSFVVAVLLYFVHYLPTPVSTWPELFAVLAQALTLNLGLEAVAQGLAKLVK